MKRFYIFNLSLTLFLFFTIPNFAQILENRDLQYFRYPDQRGLNTFETPKAKNYEFDGLKVVLGGALALQFQGIENSNNAAFLDDGNGANRNQLIDLANNFNLATANFDINAQLAKGVRLHLRTYLSSRHHTETYVKGGYLQIDRLDFIKENFLNDVMDYVTLKIGHMETNYGDAHFRRSDNAMAFYNPFVGNYILDAFTTEVGAELYFQKNNIIVMAGVTNGKLNQSVNDGGNTNVAFVGKLGYDRQINKDFRLRLTGSIYTIGKADRINLYSGDRAGSRYYSVMESITAAEDDFRSGRWSPNFADKLTSIMVNPFIKYCGFELFGTYERAEGGDFRGSNETRSWNQFAVDALYRFGFSEQFYVGVRYNTAMGKMLNSNPNEISIDRIQAGLGWFMTQNILAKFEYVNQNYNDFPKSSIYSEGKFNGYMLEAVISF